jgi:hypothetical protein|tara:strand:+ start:1607 stop:1729 length:123 start_codon:yes stop_codon:yes gene_type:complete
MIKNEQAVAYIVTRVLLRPRVLKNSVLASIEVEEKTWKIP